MSNRKKAACAACGQKYDYTSYYGAGSPPPAPCGLAGDYIGGRCLYPAIDPDHVAPPARQAYERDRASLARAMAYADQRFDAERDDAERAAAERLGHRLAEMVLAAASHTTDDGTPEIDDRAIVWSLNMAASILFGVFDKAAETAGEEIETSAAYIRIAYATYALLAAAPRMIETTPIPQLAAAAIEAAARGRDEAADVDPELRPVQHRNRRRGSKR